MISRLLSALVLIMTCVGPVAAVSPFEVDAAPGKVAIWHFYHSGFAIRTSDVVLVFDYWPGKKFDRGPRLDEVDTGEFSDGYLDSPDFDGQKVIVFISHEHHDHFYADAFRWKARAEDMVFVVSPEVSAKDKNFLGDGQTVLVALYDATTHVGAVTIKTTRSSDSGVAFLIEIDGLTIYHSGDHAAWNWDDEAEATRAFVDEMADFIGDAKIDIAMHVCDPRLSSVGWGGFVEFAAKFQPKLMVPMHSRGDYAAFEAMPATLQAGGFEGAFWPVAERGDMTIYKK